MLVDPLEDPLGRKCQFRDTKDVCCTHEDAEEVGVLPPDPAVLIPPAGGFCVEDGEVASIHELLPAPTVNNSLLPPVPGPRESPAINIIVVFWLDPINNMLIV